MKKESEMYSFSSKLWFNKRRVSESGEASLYLQVVINGAHKEYPVKLRWPVEKIDVVAGTLLPRSKKDPDVDDYNLIIQTERIKHIEVLRSYRLRNAFIDLKIFGKEIKTYDSKESFVAYMYRRVNHRYSTKDIERKTWQNAKSTLQLMINFDDSWLYSTLSLNFLKKFKQFLINQGYKPSHIWGRVKDVKTYLAQAAEEPMVFIGKDVLKFPNPEPEVKTVFLNTDEVRRLVILYKNRDYLKEDLVSILKAFLFSCFTGLRISDIYRVNGEWRLTENFLDFIPFKGRKRGRMIHVPVMPMADEFINGELGFYFNLPSEKHYNKLLKDIADKAQIKKNLTSHVGRHTYGYLYMTTIGNIKALQENMGHAKITTTERYAHLDEQYQVESVKKIQDKFSDLIRKKTKTPNLMEAYVNRPGI